MIHSTMFMEKVMRGVKVSLKTRLLLLTLLLALLPFLSYKLAQDLQEELLKQQLTNQEQLTHYLSLALQNQQNNTSPTTLEIQLKDQLPQLNLDEATLWILNSQGQTELVLGNLNLPPYLGNNLVKLGQKLFPLKTLTTEQILENKLYLKPEPLFREDAQGKPLSLMTPIQFNKDKVLIYEKPLASVLLALENFYFLVGLSSLVLLIFLLGLLLTIWSFSTKLLLLTQEVSQLFNNKTLKKLSERKPLIQDEVSLLRHQINHLLEEVLNHNDYLIQLPKSLRHELHNPINRLNLSLQQLEKSNPQLDLTSLKSGTNQLKNLINQLTEASSFEDSLANLTTPPTRALPRLLDFFTQVAETIRSTHLDTRLEIINLVTNDEIQIKADMFMLEILLDKLIENALDFSDKKEVIQITLAATNQELIISIYNSGSSLPDNTSYLFKKMVSIRNSTEENSIHLGLGLYLAQLIAEAHQASLTAKNKKQGVEFKLAVPLI